MKKQTLKAVLLTFAASAMLVGCNNWKNLSKDYYSVEPNPLEVKGGKVALNVKGQFPAKSFKSNVALEIIPEMVYADGKTPYKTVIYQGDKFPGNNEVIPYASGKSVSYSDVVDYAPAMQQSAVWAKLTGLKGESKNDLGSIKIAQGVITTALLVQDDFMVAMAPSNFVRDTQASQSGLIYFLVNQYNVRGAQLKNKDYVAVLKLMKDTNKDTKRILNSVGFIGYASPEGEETLNENLSVNRAKAVEAIVKQYVKTNKIKVENYVEKGEGADWKGFFELLTNSNMKDEDVIRRSLENEPLLSTRENTLKGMETTYPVLKDKILPELRRTEMAVNYTIIGKTDAQILELVWSDASQLTANEMMHAADLTADKAKKMDIYKKMAEIYPNDFRSFNNMGGLLYNDNKMDAAALMFVKAMSLADNQYTQNNVGVIAAAKGENAVAMDMFKKSSAPESSYNEGVLDIKAGDYPAAVAAMAGFNTFNSALAKLLNGDAQAAISTLDAAKCDCPVATYLKAIAYARLGQNDKAKDMIAQAATKDAALGVKAQTDLEFRNIK